MKDALNQVDVAFVIDTTGSMGGFIRAAQDQLRAVLQALIDEQAIDLRVGVVEFRDFPPQDTTFVTRHYPLTHDFEQVQKTLGKLQAGGGGDAPEAVYSGLADACSKLKWRPHSSRLMFLVGDAPPHAFKPWNGSDRDRVRGDGFAKGCPSGLDVASVTAKIEELGATLFALCMYPQGLVMSAFSELAEMTGGRCVAAQVNVVIREVETLLKAELEHVELDRGVLAALTENPEVEINVLAESLDVSRLNVAAAMARLGKRRLIGP